MSAASVIPFAPLAEVEARIAYVQLLPRRRAAEESTEPSGRATSVLQSFRAESAKPRRLSSQPTRETPSWLAACYALTPRVERVSAEGALLDLGYCSPEEALAAMRGLLERFRAHGRHAIAGIGPSMTVAQLAVFGSPPSPERDTKALRSLPPPSRAGRTARGPERSEEQRIALRSRHERGAQGVGGVGSVEERGSEGEATLLPAADAPAFLRGVPVSALASLYPRDRLTPEVIERLQQYGLRTLGHLARLGEPALRRQFGKAGAFLAAVAAGRDERPLQTTARSPRQHFRLRFAAGADLRRVWAILPRFARRVITSLRVRQREGRSLRLRVRWESGRVGYARLSLRQPTANARTLAQELRRLLDALLPASRDARDGATIEELRLTVGDFTLAVPDQMTLWRTQTQRRRVVETVADTLARRHNRPLLLTADLAAPAAVFAENRYRLAALSTPTGQARVSGAGRGRSGAQLRETGDTPWRQVPQRLHWW